MRAAGPFARLWAGQTVSVLGTSVSALAIPTLAILVLRVSPFAFGVLQAAEFAAFPVFGMIAGVLIDRWSRRQTMLVANVVRALVLATIPLAGALHALTFAQLLAVALVVGTASVFFELSYTSYVPALVAPERLESANARLEATNNGARFAGTGLAGALISALGAATVVIIDAASYVISPCCSSASTHPNRISRIRRRACRS
jgi:MFS family permease